MANLIESLGYSLGKVHVGLLAYMCNLVRAGTVGPLEAFLQSLDIPVPHDPVPYREWKAARGVRLDLAIFDGDAGISCIIVEMKVDDREVGQTTLYADATPDVPYRLFVTLGHGEYYHPPYDTRFRWIRLPEFAQAVKVTCAAYPNVVPLQDWAIALQHELDRRHAVANNDRHQLRAYRPGFWNINFLGQLKEALLLALGSASLDIDPTCYTHGTRPDTILNFGWSQDPRYAEINNNGRLNVKISFGNCETEADRQVLYQQTMQLLLKNLGVGNNEIRAYNAGSATMTIVSLDIGLVTPHGALAYGHAQAYTVNALIGYLQVLYDFLGTAPSMGASEGQEL